MKKINKYMMATKAIHKLGDISRDMEDICQIHLETEKNYIGSWVTGYGFLNVHFPKETTRDLTEEEREKYRSMNFQMSSQPPFKLSIGMEV